MRYWLYKDEQIEIVQEGLFRSFLWFSIAFCGVFLFYLLLKIISTQDVTYIMPFILFLLVLILFIGLLLTTYFIPAQKKLWFSVWTLEALPSSNPPLSLHLDEQNIQIPFASYIKREPYFRYACPHLISLPTETPIQLKLNSKTVSFTVTYKTLKKAPYLYLVKLF